MTPDDGKVSCAFTQQIAFNTNSPRCPEAAKSLKFAANYKFDNDLWLHDFEKVFKRMLNNGYNYNANQVCPGGMCSYDGPS